MTNEMLLEVEGVSRHYALPRRHLLAPSPRLTAVNEISVSLRSGESLGIVGESGSGKSTLARLVMGFERPDNGRILFAGTDLNAIPRGQLARLRRQFQIVFQDPFGSLDPRRPVGWSITEPLLGDKTSTAATRQQRAHEALAQVGLKASDAGKYPHEFSGGQRQRIAIARALVTKPRLLVADEPVSALDVSVQAQILNLLMDMQEKFGLTLVLISHDLAVIANLCERVMVMHHGRVVEAGPTRDVLSAPKHAYTQSLLEAATGSLS